MRRAPWASLIRSYLRDSCTQPAVPPRKGPGKRRGVLVGALRAQLVLAVRNRGRPGVSLSFVLAGRVDYLPAARARPCSFLAGIKGTPMAPSTSSSAPRVVSLLPAATEMVCLVGGQKSLVGRGHEDDFPLDITDRPVVTAARHSFTTSSDIDKKVSESLAKGEGLYFLDALLLKSLRPTVIITQALCSVCAIDYNLVVKIARNLDRVPHVVSLNPNTFEDILDDILLVGEAIGHVAEAEMVVRSLNRRIESAKAHVKVKAKSERPRVVFMEWTDPIFCAGHWTPQLIEMAGGEHPLNPCTFSGKAKESFRVSPEDVSLVDPDWVIISPCGLDIATTKQEMRTLVSQDWWKDLRAVKEDRVVIVDGNQMFNRSGPRIVDAFEWLVGLLNESLACMPPGFPWEKWGIESVSPLPVMIHPPARDNHVPCYNHACANESSTDRFHDPWVEVMDEGWRELHLERDIEEAHEAASKEGKSMYKDPSTGFMVFTRSSLYDRGTCCGNRCRHCPFGHYNVSRVKGPRERTIRGPTFMATEKINRRLRTEPSIDALNWSGDISSHFALKELKSLCDSHASTLNNSPNNSAALKPQSSSSNVLLCTFFDPMTGRVVPLGESMAVPDAVSPVGLYAIMDQARCLDAPLLAIPVKRHCSSHELALAVEEGFSHVPVKIRKLVMGLMDITPDLSQSQAGGRDALLSELTRERLPYLWASSEVKGRVFFRRGYMDQDLHEHTVYSEEFLRTLPASVSLLGSPQTFWVHMNYDIPR